MPSPWIDHVLETPPETPRPALKSFFSPKAIAIIGATEKPGSVGRALMENLRVFDGPVYPVNPHHATVLGLASYSHIAATPGKVDLAVIATPAQTVPGIIADCVRTGVRAAVIISSGFKECGAEGAALEARIINETRRGPLRIIGPNCLGVMVPHAGLNATFAAAQARPGNVAFVSQSGALCTAILDWSLRENVGFSAFISVGSMLDVGWGDLIRYLGDDPHTHSIVIYMESVGDAHAFLSAARTVTSLKPIVVIKVGRTEAAAQAAASHTGALTGSDDVLDAAFRRAGVLRVATIEELFGMAELLSKQPRPRGPRLAIVTNAGGPGALAADMLVGTGGRLAPLSPPTRAQLDRLLPAPWSHGNPIDILGEASAHRYAAAVQLAMREPQSDGVLVILTPQAMTNPSATADGLRHLTRIDGKPLLASWMGGAHVEDGRLILREAGIPTFDYPDEAARAFSLMWRYSENLPRNSAASQNGATVNEGPQPFKERASEIIAAARAAGRTILTEYESKQILAAYALPAIETRLARTEEEAVATAKSIGFPVVLKLHSETITHKADVGGVRLDIREESEVRQSWQTIRNSVREKAGVSNFLGVTVQPMVISDGFELILGSSLDVQFGPVLLFGAGGRLVEVFGDHALGFPPLDAILARRLMEQTKIFTALAGMHGHPPVDLAALEQILVRFSRLVAEQRWIKEIDVNPLLASAERIIALDARILLHGPEVRLEQLPMAAAAL